MSPGNAAHAETHAPKAAPAKHDKRRQRSPSTADMSTDAAFDLRRMSTREAGEKARRGAAEQQGSDSRHAVAASDARRGLATLRLSAQGTLEYRVHFTYDAAPMSPWHDIPLHAGNGHVHFVCEIPKWTRAKFEIATAEAGNPIKQDEKKGVLRDYKWGDMVFNYGALPQTWEDPAHCDADTGCKGDNDPLDAVEFGYRAMRTGSVAPVKVLGVLAMIDDGETDWKLLVLRADDPLAAVCHDVADLERELPGAVSALREWLRVYKLPEGKPLNAFALGERAMPREYAMRVVADTHAAWAATHGEAAHKRARGQHAAAPAEDAAAPAGAAAARL